MNLCHTVGESTSIL